jgi:hypothetical protein
MPPSPDVVDTSSTTSRNQAKMQEMKNPERPKPRCNHRYVNGGTAEFEMLLMTVGLMRGLFISLWVFLRWKRDTLFWHVLIAPAK